MNKLVMFVVNQVCDIAAPFAIVCTMCFLVHWSFPTLVSHYAHLLIMVWDIKSYIRET